MARAVVADADAVHTAVIRRAPVVADRAAVVDDLRRVGEVVGAGASHLVANAKRRLIADQRLVRAHHHLHDQLHGVLVVGPGHTDPVLSDIPGALRPVPGLPAEGEEVGLCKMVSCQGRRVAQVVYTDDCGVLLTLGSAVDDLTHGDVLAVCERIGLENLFPFGAEIAQAHMVPGVLLCDLQLNGLVGQIHCAEHRVDRLPALEIQRAVFGLHKDVFTELTTLVVIDRLEFHICALQTVGVHAGVIYKGTPEQRHVVFQPVVHVLQRLSHAVGAVAVVIAIVLRAGLTLGVGFHSVSDEVGDAGADLLRLLGPPVPEDIGLRVVRVRARDGARTARRGVRRGVAGGVGGGDVAHGKTDLHAVGPKCVSQRSLHQNVFFAQIGIVCVHVVDGDFVDTDARAHPGENDVSVQNHRQTVCVAV